MSPTGMDGWSEGPVGTPASGPPGPSGPSGSPSWSRRRMRPSDSRTAYVTPPSSDSPPGSQARGSRSMRMKTMSPSRRSLKRWASLLLQQDRPSGWRGRKSSAATSMA
ncbi:hypothetical protein D7X99_09775 [Corallococcus sp. AB032C]|nr:hypothetical protein D7X99_09775 [Corallococcus sp. AB032C]